MECVLLGYVCVYFVWCDGACVLFGAIGCMLFGVMVCVCGVMVCMCGLCVWCNCDCVCVCVHVRVCDQLRHMQHFRSFGVLLWEVMGRGEFPYQELGDSDVVDAVCHTRLTLLQPAECPDTV